MFTSIIGAAGLTALIVGLGFLLAKFSDAFSSFDPIFSRQIVEVDEFRRPVRWETNDEREHRLYCEGWA
jgi:hypothetical protein